MAIDLFPADLEEQAPDAPRRLLDACITERRRRARDLREGPLRELRDLSLDMRLGRGLVEDDPARAIALLDEATARIDAAADALRDVARDLFPAALEPTARRRGVRSALNGLSQRDDVRVVVLAAPDEPLPAAIEAIAYAMAAEGVANAALHGRATLVEIEVRRDGSELLVRVVDDGIGGAEPRPGGGIEALIDRASALGGRASVLSPAWAGTALQARLPLD